MNPSEIVLSVETRVKTYLMELENWDMEQLCRKPSEDAWSLGQMLVHLMTAPHFMQLRNLELCRDASNPAVQIGGAKSPIGEEVFRMGSFPPDPIRVPPSPQYTPAEPQSKDEIRVGMQDVISRMRSTAETLEEIPVENTVEHPRFGYLNAREWFQLIEMHYRHHLLQLNRLKAFLGA